MDSPDTDRVYPPGSITERDGFRYWGLQGDTIGMDQSHVPPGCPYPWDGSTPSTDARCEHFKHIFPDQHGNECERSGCFLRQIVADPLHSNFDVSWPSKRKAFTLVFNQNTDPFYAVPKDGTFPICGRVGGYSEEVGGAHRFGMLPFPPPPPSPSPPPPFTTPSPPRDAKRVCLPVCHHDPSTGALIFTGRQSCPSTPRSTTRPRGDRLQRPVRSNDHHPLRPGVAARRRLHATGARPNYRPQGPSASLGLQYVTSSGDRETFRRIGGEM